MVSFLVVSCLLVCAAAVSRRRPALRVVDGEEDAGRVLSYVVSLEDDNVTIVQTWPPLSLRICTGTLIADKWVLTAAHCIVPTLKRVRYGDMSVSYDSPKNYSRVINTFRHPSYKFIYVINAFNDIALMLVERISMNVFGMISAVDYTTLMGRATTLAGYGLNIVSSNWFEKIKHMNESMKLPLQVGKSVVVPCQKSYYMTSPAICTAPRCSRRWQVVTNGDSGGPLLLGGRVIGVANSISFWMDENGKSRVEAIYAPVSVYIDWIQMTIEQNLVHPAKD